MLKLLIIDDDALTRKGIQTLMPWAAHNMEIVGEASNGRAALEFLKYHEVDLALVDLDMPVMNGTTFIQMAKELYPSLNYVVLTIHTEFEYIQQVLRLGAIDYIAKTQFDQENFDQILERINASIYKKIASTKGMPDLKWKESKILYPYIYALITIDSDNDEQIFQFEELNNIQEQTDFYEMMSGIWTFTSDLNDFLFPDSFTNTTLLRISDVSDMTYAQLGKLLRNYKNEQFFYDYQPIHKINHKRVHELMENAYITDDCALDKLKEEWISLNWVCKSDLFDKLKFDLKNSRMKVSKLYHLLLTLESVWNSSYSEMTGQIIKLPSSFHSWTEVEEWLMSLYERTNLFSASSKYSSDVTKCILAAKQYIDNHFSSILDSTEIARNANMSYGYFSRCFHDIVGMSFSDYCISVRMRQAASALLHTSNSVQQIAYDAGYHDEKYFSRLFKKYTGLSPTDYRKTK